MAYVIDFLKNIKTTAFSIGVTDIIEILIIAFIIYKLIEWMKNSRTWFLLKGLLVIAALFVVAEVLQLNTILYIARSALDILVIALLVIFQPELRTALERLGKESAIVRFFTKGSNSSAVDVSEIARNEIVKASFALGETKTGALIVIEREYPLAEYIKTGIPLNSDISSELLVNIFEHNTPLHDGAAIICGNKIAAATCYLPLSSNLNISKDLGTRHRAALGASEDTDALTIIVSEETGNVSIARGGKLIEGLTEKELLKELEIISVDEVEANNKSFIRRRKDEETDSE